MSAGERVLGELGGPAFAVLDGARDPRIRGWVLDTRAPRACLYRGRLTPELEDAAPWLLQLDPQKAYTADFFRRWFGAECAVLLSSRATLTQLRRHLRRFLVARDEQKRVLIFRYYDPRILRAYLPTLTPAEAAEFFGPIDAFAVEADVRGRALLFRQGAQAQLFAA